MAIFDWERKSELSADRAGLICVQDRHIANRTFMKMACATPKFYDQMSEEEFTKQIKTYEEASDSSFLNQAYITFITAKMNHPFTIMRAKHLDNWIEKGEFTNVTGINL